MPGASSDAIKAGEAFVELNADDKKFQSVLNKNAERFRRFGSFIRNVGVGAIAIGTSVLAPLVAATVSSLKFLDSIQDIADRTNSSAESVSRLAYAANLSATSIEEVEAANKLLTKSTLAAIDGTQEQAEAFKALGIDASEFIDLEIDEKFLRISSALQGINSQEEKARILIALLGKSAAGLIPLLENGAEGLRDLFDEAEKSGAVVKAEDAKKAAAIMDTFDKVMTNVKGILIEVAMAVVSLFGEGEEGLKTVFLYLKSIREWIKENRRLVGIIAAVVAGVVALGGALVVVGMLVPVVIAGAKALAAVLGVVFGTVGLVVIKFLAVAAIIAVVVGAIYLLIKYLTETTETGQRLKKSLGEAFDFIKEKILSIPDAARNAVQWVVERFNRLRAVSTFVNDIVSGITSRIRDLFSWFGRIGTMWRNIFRNLGELFGETWGGIIGAIKKADFTLLGHIVSTAFLIGFKELVFGAKRMWFDVIDFMVNSFNDGLALIEVFFRNLIKNIKQLGLSGLKVIIDKAIEGLEFINIAGALNDEIKKAKDASAAIQGEINNIQGEKVKVEAAVIGEAERFKEERAKKREREGLKDLEDLKDKRELLRQLIAKATAVEPPAPEKLPVAPMPHKPPPRDRFGRRMEIDKTLDQLGNSVRGLFSSADYQASLGIGDANDTAKKQLEVNKEIRDEMKNLDFKGVLNAIDGVHGELAAINAKVGFGEFV